MTRPQKSELKKYIDEIKEEAKEGKGRISGLTWEMLVQIKALLFDGQFQKYIFQSLGIPKTTWDRWASRGREIRTAIQNGKKKWDKVKDIEKRYCLLASYIERGKAKAIAKHHAIISVAGKKDWKASAWFLEMQDREKYGKKVEAEIKHAFVTMEDLLEDEEGE